MPFLFLNIYFTHPNPPPTASHCRFGYDRIRNIYLSQLGTGMLWALDLYRYSSNRCDNRGGVYEPYMGLTTYVELTLPQLG